jgi:hypothetical protein
VLDEPAAQLGGGARLLLDQLTARRGEGVEVEAGQLLGVRGLQVSVEQRLHHRPQGEAVGGGDQVDGAAHQRDAYDAPVEDQPGEVVRLEALNPRPQPEVRRERRLCLHPHQVGDRLRRGHRGTREQ